MTRDQLQPLLDSVTQRLGKKLDIIACNITGGSTTTGIEGLDLIRYCNASGALTDFVAAIINEDRTGLTFLYFDQNLNPILIQPAGAPCTGSNKEVIQDCRCDDVNGDGVLTGGIAVDCNKEQDARTFFICTDEDCTVVPPSCVSCPQSYLPNDVYTEVMDALNHEPEIGDTIFLQHPTGHSFHKWNGSIWERSGCGCISYANSNPYPTAVSVTGTTTKTVTITMSSGAPLTTTFTDLDNDTNTTYTLVPNVGNTAFDLVDNNSNVVSTITFPTTSSVDGADVSIEFTPAEGTSTFDTSILFPTCSGTKTYSIQYFDNNVFSTISIDSNGVISYDFYPYSKLTVNQLIITRVCNGITDILRLNYRIDYSFVTQINSYWSEGFNFPDTYNLMINDTVPQLLKFSNEYGQGNLFTSINSGTALRFDGLNGITGAIFEIHLTGNISMPTLSEATFTIRLLNNGVPSGNSKIINRWNSLHSFSKLFIDTINTLDNISFDIIYSDSTVPTDLDVEFNDVKVFIRPIGFAV